jgi:hypothetical protein
MLDERVRLEDNHENQQSKIPKSFHEKAGPCQEFFCSLHNFFHFPFSQAAYVATLPSALVVERFSLGASWVFLIH